MQNIRLDFHYVSITLHFPDPAKPVLSFEARATEAYSATTSGERPANSLLYSATFKLGAYREAFGTCPTADGPFALSLLEAFSIISNILEMEKLIDIIPEMQSPERRGIPDRMFTIEAESRKINIGHLEA